MSEVVIEHVPVSELPPAWRAKFAMLPGVHVTVRIEAESQSTESAAGDVTDDPAFGIWRDHDDSANVESYVDDLRAPRYKRDGSRTVA